MSYLLDQFSRIHKRIFSLIILLLTLFLCLTLKTPVALAHAPHDVITQLELSPSYSRDKTAFILVRGILMRSSDGGHNWQRLVRGLDYKVGFTSLSIADSNPQILFLGSLGDGIYKSIDQGKSWVKTNQGLTDLDIDLIAVSPQSADFVLAASKNQGLYSTYDGGETWQPILDKGVKITAISFYKISPDVIFIADQNGQIYLSKTQGKTWQTQGKIQESGKITALGISPLYSEDNTLFIGTEKQGVLKSSDGGNTFSSINRGIQDKNIRDLLVLGTKSNELHLLASTWQDGFFQSNNSGVSWEKSSQGLTKNSQADEPKFSSPHFSKLAISEQFSQDKTLFLAGFNGLFKSIDEGHHWQELETLSPKLITTLSISPNYKNDSTVAIGTYQDGFYISRDRGKNWQPSNIGFYIPSYKSGHISISKPRFFDLRFSPNYQNDKSIFSSLTFNYISSHNRGLTWKKTVFESPVNRSTREIIVAPSPNIANDQTIYLVTYSGLIYTSNDLGKSFSLLSKLEHRITSLNISPNFAIDKTLYVSAFDGILSSKDGGKNWQETGDKNQFTGKIWYNLSISPNFFEDKTLIAGTDQGIFKSENEGKTWRKLQEYTDSVVEAIAISPDYKNDQTFLVSLRGMGTYKTTDNGKTFTQIAQDLFENNYAMYTMSSVASSSSPIQFSPNYANDKTLYGFGTNATEVFQSEDGGNSWKLLKVRNQVDILSSLVTSLYVINLAFHVYPILKIIAALGGATIIYYLLGYFQLSRQKVLYNIQSRVLITSLVFIAILGMLYQ